MHQLVLALVWAATSTTNYQLGGQCPPIQKISCFRVETADFYFSEMADAITVPLLSCSLSF